VVQALLLQFQPTFLDILPLYIVLLLAFPVILLGLRRQPLLVLLASAVLYLAVQVYGIQVPRYPEDHVWTFNPLAWQFVFVLGAVLGVGVTRHPGVIWLTRTAYPAALAVAVATLVLRLSWTLHGFWDAVPGLLLRQIWPISKSDLSPFRLVSFFAVVVLVGRWVMPQAAFMRWPAARPLVLCGRHSLEIFCVSILLSVLGHFLLSEYNSGLVMQSAVNLVGIGAMFGIAKMLDWYRRMQSVPALSAVANSSEAAGGE
jgi:hypothetical protein